MTQNRIHRSLASLELPRAVGALVPHAQGVVSAMTDNPHFPSPVPALWIVSQAIGELRTAEAAVLTGARGTARVRDDKRTTLVALLHQLRAYVQVIADPPGRSAARVERAVPVPLGGQERGVSDWSAPITMPVVT